MSHFFIVVLNVFMLSVVMLNILMLSVVMLNVVILVVAALPQAQGSMLHKVFVQN